MVRAGCGAEDTGAGAEGIELSACRGSACYLPQLFYDQEPVIKAKNARKLLFVCNFFPPFSLGGYEIGAHSLIRGLEKRGHRVRVLTSAPIRGGVYIKTHNEIKDVRAVFSPIYRLYRVTAPLVRTESFYAYDKYQSFAGYRLENIEILRQQIDEFKPELVYFFNPLGLGTLGLLEYCQDIGIPYVVHAMDHLSRYLLEDAEKIGLADRMRLALAFSAWVFCSHNVAVDYPIAKIIPNTPGPAFWRHKKPPLRRSGPLRVAYWGRICIDKGLPAMTEIARRLENESWFAGLDAIGTSEGVEFPTNIAKLRHLPPKDISQNISLLRRRYDAAVFPLSSNEPFAYSPLEAVLMGLPTVVSANTGGAEHYVDGPSPLAPRNQNDIEGFVGALKQIYEGRADQEVARMRQRVESCLQPKRVVDQMEAFVEEVIDRHAQTLRQWRYFTGRRREI